MARVPSGLEQVVIADLKAKLRATNLSCFPRTIIFQSSCSWEELLAYPGYESLYLILAKLSGCSHKRELLPILPQMITEALSSSGLSKVEQFLGLPTNAVTGISATFTGKRNYNRFELANAVGQSYLSKSPQGQITTMSKGWEPHDLHLRLHLVDQLGFLGARLSAKPLAKRAYKEHQASASLSPIVAYHLINLGDPKAGELLLDPCCGVGTIPLEASYWPLLQGAIGADIDLERVVAARLNHHNLQTASSRSESAEAFLDPRNTIPISFFQGSAFNLALPSESIDLIVSDLPWGNQVSLLDSTIKSPKSTPAALKELLQEFDRVLKKAGRVIVMTGAEADLLSALETSAFESAKLSEIWLSGAGAVIYRLSRIS